MLAGNARLKELIASLISKGREPHSLIITGEHGQGRKTAAKYISQALLCEQQSGTPCGRCLACKKIKNGTHPDVMFLKANENGNYQVDTVREIVSDAIVSPNEGRFKVYIIPDFDKSRITGEQAQNILLKLIEEPPEHTVIILTADSKEAFLPTIISRALALSVVPCSVQECAEYLGTLQKYSYGEIGDAVSAIGGNIGKCIEYLEKENIFFAVKYARDICKALTDRNEYVLLMTLTECDCKKGLLRQTLECISGIARDSAVISMGGSATGCDKEGAMVLSGRLGAAGSQKMYEVICNYIKKLDSNCSKTLTVNALCADLSVL